MSIVCRSHAPATHRTLHQMYPPSADALFVQEMSTQAQLSLARFDARLGVLSLFVLRFLNLLVRSPLAGVQYCARGFAWRASNQEFCLVFLLQSLQSLLVLSCSEVQELSVVMFCCHDNDET